MRGVRFGGRRTGSGDDRFGRFGGRGSGRFGGRRFGAVRGTVTLTVRRFGDGRLDQRYPTIPLRNILQSIKIVNATQTGGGARKLAGCGGKNEPRRPSCSPL